MSMPDIVIQSALVVVPILIYKLAILFVGYLIVKMGFTLLRDGIKGEFSFKAEMTGYKADLVSVSPGTFFVLLGVVLLAVSVTSKNQFSFPSDQTTKPSTLNQEGKVSLPSKLPKSFYE